MLWNVCSQQGLPMTLICLSWKVRINKLCSDACNWWCHLLFCLGSSLLTFKHRPCLSLVQMQFATKLWPLTSLCNLWPLSLAVSLCRSIRTSWPSHMTTATFVCMIWMECASAAFLTTNVRYDRCCRYKLSQRMVTKQNNARHYKINFRSGTCFIFWRKKIFPVTGHKGAEQMQALFCVMTTEVPPGDYKGA